MTFVSQQKPTTRSVQPAYFWGLRGLTECHEGLTTAKLNGKWGFIDRTGEFVIEPTYEGVSGRFDKDTGLAFAKRNGKFGFINRTGKFVIEPTYEMLMGLGKDSNHALVSRNGKWGIIERTTGKVLIEPIYEKAQRPEQIPDIVKITLDGKWGLIDRTGKVAAKPMYDQFGDFDKVTGLGLVKLNGKWGLINTQGRVVVAPKYEYIKHLTDGVYRVGTSGSNTVDPTDASGAKRSRFYVGGDGKFREAHTQVPACGFPDLKLPEDFSVLAAGAYSGRKINFQIDQSGHEATQIDVAVNSQNKPVVLMLGAYEPTIWNVSWTKKTKILAVLVGGYHRQAVAGLAKDTPLLVNSHDNKGACGYFYITPDNLEPLNPLSRRVFGKPVETVYFAKEGKVDVGNPMSAGIPLVRSADNTPESFHDKNTPMAGPAGVADAARKGLLRKATAADAEAWVDAVIKNSPQRDLPPVAGQGVPRPPKPPMYDTYVVLKSFTYPAGLYGGNSVTFLIPKDVPKPEGNPGHSGVYDFNTLKCQGPSCGTR